MLVVKFTALYGANKSIRTNGAIQIDYAHCSLMEIRTKVAQLINQPVFDLTISI